MLNNDSNRQTWNTHYLRDKSKLYIPDENIVRFIQHYFRRFPEVTNPVILEIGSGSGRNIAYLRSVTPNVFGMDFAQNSLIGQPGVVCALSDENPFQDQSLDIVIAWGVLHYLTNEQVDKTLNEVRRILKPSGIFFGTIRSDKDTHLSEVLKTGDLKNGSARLYSDMEVMSLFKNFKNTRLGFISRRQPGEKTIVAHHIFEAAI
ncbi:MAG: class I SAM-dependent methyltransferase [Spirochaetia bacterium]|nr:class I SAM-dependent methyltransferase [Spirochaetia bacterium]